MMPAPDEPPPSVVRLVAHGMGLPPEAARYLVASAHGLAVFDRLIELRRQSAGTLPAKTSPHLRAILVALGQWAGECEFSAPEALAAATCRDSLRAALEPITREKKEPANALGKFLLGQAEVPIDGLTLVRAALRDGVNRFKVLRE